MNDFRYIPKNEIICDILGWITSTEVPLASIESNYDEDIIAGDKVSKLKKI